MLYQMLESRKIGQAMPVEITINLLISAKDATPMGFDIHLKTCRIEQ